MHSAHPMPRATRPMRAFVALPALLALLALSSGTVSAGPETLVFLDTRKETLYVHIDYNRAPEVAAPAGWGSWQEIEKDSFYVTDAGTTDEATHLRYTRAFYAELDGRKAGATDYIYYHRIKDQEPHYTAEIIFNFVRGDTLEIWTSGPGHHMQDEPRIFGYEDGVHAATDLNFIVDLSAAGKSLPRPEGFVEFLDRRPGWIGEEGPISLARDGKSGLAQPRHGWVGRGKQAVLTVPDHASRLLLLDANGRTAWKAEALTPGARLDAPAGLRTGPIRYIWLP